MREAPGDPGTGQADARLQGFAAQRNAADPAVSAWVAANAGAGKTRVLTDRVLRLLLAGARPASILCLTFTKAAAAEMANRLHRSLSGWTMMSEDGLQAVLQPLLGHAADAETCRRARRLFAATLEAPGGLRIQTIHAFCESVLKRFPVEAGVPPHFAIADDPTAREMVANAIARVLAAAPGDAELGRALALLADRVDETGFDRAIQELVGNRRLLRRVLHPDGTAGALAALQACLAIARDATADALRGRFVEEIPCDALLAAAEALSSGGKTDCERGAALRAFLAPAAAADRLDPDWFDIFLTKKLEPRAESRLVSKKLLGAAPGILETLLAEQARCLDLLDRLRAMAVAEASAAMLHLGAEILSLYELEKSRRAALDDDDRILTVRDLLAAPGRAPWVLFKLDGGIDHVLVDEAQDTSLEQWEIVTALTGEFFAGEGQRAGAEPARTLFAVGDEKQSIFGFQGAAPAAFQHMRRRLAALAEAGRRPWRDVDLALSFRTVPLLLRAVDAVFARPETQDGVAEAGVVHAPFRIGDGGLVELWPTARPAPAAAESEPWDAPLDYIPADSAPALLARRIATTIGSWIGTGESLDSAGRPIAPGDIMILVRRRDALFRQIVAALKGEGLPVAGEDRLKLGDSLAVQDLLAVARFCLLPEDDLSLATVLRGPFCDTGEDSLMALCLRSDGRPWAGRSWDGGLWRHLRRVAGERPDWQHAAGFLREALALADYVTPHAFFARLLERGGLARLQRRLGEQAREPVEELLNLALAYGRGTAENLQGFLAWFEAGGAEIKRDLEQAGGEIRVLTVHAAKGLEAPVVFLPDTTGRPDGRFDPPVLWPEGPPPALLWAPRAADDDRVTGETRDRHRRLQLAEYRRLLYVAMTRARDRLYVCGWENRKRPDGCWYDLVAEGLADLAGGQEIDLPWGETGQRWAAPQTGLPTAGDGQEAQPQPVRAGAVPDWARLPAPEEPEPPRPLAPSRQAEPPAAISPRTGPGRDALARGRLIHTLLQVLPDLPAAERQPAGAALLHRAAPDLPDDVRAALLAEAVGILDDSRFAAAFGSGSRAEVALAGRVGGAVLSGRIDRLAVSDDRVLVIDYKTQEAPPEAPGRTPLQHLRQLALYRDLLRRIYPDRPVDCAILWTAGPHLMALPPDLLDRALPGWQDS
ncbi:MAG: double-strand break repair helicase AddA [Sneathiellaceae bacterium]